MLTVREVARILHVHESTVRRWANNGYLTAYRITGRGDRRFSREDIQSFLKMMKSNNGHAGKSGNGGNGNGGITEAGEFS